MRNKLNVQSSIYTPKWYLYHRNSLSQLQLPRHQTVFTWMSYNLFLPAARYEMRLKIQIVAMKFWRHSQQVFRNWTWFQDTGNLLYVCNRGLSCFLFPFWCRSFNLPLHRSQIIWKAETMFSTANITGRH